MATFEATIIDMTDSWLERGEGETLDKMLEAVAANLERRIEMLASHYGYGANHSTEQGIPFTSYMNGAIKRQCETGRRIKCGDLTAASQFKAMQEAADATYDCVLANKPPDADLLIWRHRPEASRCLKPDGLEVKIYARLAWDKFRGTE